MAELLSFPRCKHVTIFPVAKNVTIFPVAIFFANISQTCESLKNHSGRYVPGAKQIFESGLQKIDFWKHISLIRILLDLHACVQN